ncbi:MAG: hypothetical protein K6E55_03175 [Thermoguttaceae bacterium]|nr:hypothetical protein [Thermoguttaceae bacterium]
MSGNHTAQSPQARSLRHECFDFIVGKISHSETIGYFANLPADSAKPLPVFEQPIRFLIAASAASFIRVRAVKLFVRRGFDSRFSCGESAELADIYPLFRFQGVIFNEQRFLFVLVRSELVRFEQKINFIESLSYLRKTLGYSGNAPTDFADQLVPPAVRHLLQQ